MCSKHCETIVSGAVFPLAVENAPVILKMGTGIFSSAKRTAPPNEKGVLHEENCKKRIP